MTHNRDRLPAYTMYVLYRVFVEPEYLQYLDDLDEYSSAYDKILDDANIRGNMAAILYALSP